MDLIETDTELRVQKDVDRVTQNSIAIANYLFKWSTETLAFTHDIHFLLLFALRIGLGFARIKIRIIVTVVIIVIILIRFLFFTVTFILKCFPSEEKHSPRYYPLPDVVADLEIGCK